jgi:hypothetical protein
MPSRFFLRPLAALVLTAAVAALTASAAQARPLVVGLGDQQPTMWQDSRFADLGIRHVRLIVPYDLVLRGNTRYDAWLRTARARRADVMVAFHHQAQNPRYLPSVKEYARGVRAFHRRYPWIRTLTTWNESNHHSQPTWKSPALVGRYYLALRKVCRRCTIVAADVGSPGSAPKWLRAFRRVAPRARLWGLHNYNEVNRLKTPPRRSTTAKFARRMPGQTWITETGGLVSFKDIRNDEGGAARAMARTFALARANSKIRRIYLYGWNGNHTAWDSGVVAPDGRARPGLDVLRREVNRERARAGRGPVAPLPARVPGWRLLG